MRLFLNFGFWITLLCPCYAAALSRWLLPPTCSFLPDEQIYKGSFVFLLILLCVELGLLCLTVVPLSNTESCNLCTAGVSGRSEMPRLGDPSWVSMQRNHRIKITHRIVAWKSWGGIKRRKQNLVPFHSDLLTAGSSFYSVYQMQKAGWEGER